MFRAGTPLDAGDLSSELGNADCPWDDFDSYAYLQHNYGRLHDLDRLIVKHLARFFETAVYDRAAPRHALDVGTGTNLYPALAMLPISETVTFWEYSARNVTWLRDVLGPTGHPAGPPWRQFWDLLSATSPIYDANADLDSELKRKANEEPTKQSIFDLPKAIWNLGTMFFVAESITAKYDEFESATRKFLLALEPGAPFAAAFMENSSGYSVGNLHFPAVSIDRRDVERALRGIAGPYEVMAVGAGKKFRPGYRDVLLVTGYRSRVGSDAALLDRPVSSATMKYVRARATRNR